MSQYKRGYYIDGAWVGYDALHADGYSFEPCEKFHYYDMTGEHTAWRNDSDGFYIPKDRKWYRTSADLLAKGYYKTRRDVPKSNIQIYSIEQARLCAALMEDGYIKSQEAFGDEKLTMFEFYHRSGEWGIASLKMLALDESTGARYDVYKDDVANRYAFVGIYTDWRELADLPSNLTLVDGVATVYDGVTPTDFVYDDITT